MEPDTTAKKFISTREVWKQLGSVGIEGCLGKYNDHSGSSILTVEALLGATDVCLPGGDRWINKNPDALFLPDRDMMRTGKTFVPGTLIFEGFTSLSQKMTR